MEYNYIRWMCSSFCPKILWWACLTSGISPSFHAVNPFAVFGQEVPFNIKGICLWQCKLDASSTAADSIATSPSTADRAQQLEYFFGGTKRILVNRRGLNFAQWFAFSSEGLQPTWSTYHGSISIYLIRFETTIAYSFLLKPRPVIHINFCKSNQTH